MGLLIFGLILGFGGVVGLFYVPVLGILYAAVVAGMATRSPMKGLFAGAGASAIVGAVLKYLPSGTNILGGGQDAYDQLIRTMSGAALSLVENQGLVDTLKGEYWFIVIALAIFGAVGGLIGGIAKKED
ncbi:MAG: hypothetical protein HN929_02585 [Chloroflexi bacterium]|jgi:hypothetical protein|nr:hypothetical protein [Chloroflexota bacterium]MBT7080348.1 hypothetical protein [Chloroflexota bacterium]MBT7290363.1 hypothetical protein [Chloroflexota bacterium]